MEIQITYTTCGHTETRSIPGFNIYEVEHNADWHRNNRVCSECYTATVEQTREKQIRDAKDRGSMNGLHDLKGTEKQEKWGMAIRQVKIDEAGRYMNQLRADLDSYKADLAKPGRFSQHSERRVNQITAQLEKFESEWQECLRDKVWAKFWIEQRSSNLPCLVQEAVNPKPIEFV